MADNILIRICRVETISDKSDAGRIKVRIPGIDTNTPEEKLPWCFPLLPKLIHVRPKVGEAVLVFFEELGSPRQNRFYIGPVYSQAFFYGDESFDGTALDALVGAMHSIHQPPSANSDYNATFPKQDDVALIGKNNAQVVLKDNEVRSICGQQENHYSKQLLDRMDFNTINPSYVQLKYYGKEQTTQKKNSVSGTTDKYNSVVNVGADRINFISRKGKTDTASTIEHPEELMTSDELGAFLDRSHPMIYGDELVAFLKQMRDFMLTHTHPFPKKPPIPTATATALAEKDLESMLADYARLS